MSRCPSGRIIVSEHPQNRAALARCKYMSIIIYVLLGISALLSVIVIISNT